MIKNVLVTGGTGYIGSHTVVELIKAGYVPIIVDNLCNSKVEVLDRIEKITGVRPAFRYLDVRDKKALDKVFKEFAIDAVIHFAGLKAVGESVKKPDLYFANNVGSTKTLLKVMTHHHVERIVFSSSATVYGDPKHVPLVETDPTGATTNPYAATKYESELLLRKHQARHPSFAVALLRYFNPVGAHKSGLIGEDPRGIPNNLMPFVSQVAVGRLPQLKVFGNDYPTSDGTGVRDYIHVVDLAIGHVLTLKKLSEGSGVFVYNLGTGHGSSVLELVKAFEEASKKKIPYEIVARRSGDIAACYADVKKAEKELGFKATHSLIDCCRDSWAWQKANPLGYDQAGSSNRESISYVDQDGRTLAGHAWKCQNPQADLFIVTGMEEHALRYEGLASFLNAHAVNVYCLDHYGQGANVTDGHYGLVVPGFFQKTVENIDGLIKKYHQAGRPVYLFGHSLGSFFVQRYIQLHGEHIDKAIIMGTNGPSNKALYKLGHLLAALLIHQRNYDRKAKLFAKLAFGSFNKRVKDPETPFDWLSYDKKNVYAYLADPACGYGSSNGFFRELLKGNSALFHQRDVRNIPHDLPLLIVSGADDPAGDFGKGPRSLLRMYQKVGIKDVTLRLYPHMRHEILHEGEHETVFHDLLSFFGLPSDQAS